MKIHSQAALTVSQRRHIKELYESGEYSLSALGRQFGTTHKTIEKWVKRETFEDQSSAPKHPRRSITPEFELAVKAYRESGTTCHEGVKRIAEALKTDHTCSNASNVDLVLRRLRLQKAPIKSKREPNKIPVGKHRTQMDIQQLPAVEGGSGFEYKISIIHLSTRVKYSEIRDNYETKTIAEVYQRALDCLPPFL